MTVGAARPVRAASGGRPPNVLIVMSDEHDPAISSAYGHPFVATPAMERLAAAGARFDAAYCNSPICAPSRASFVTGKHLHRIGVWDHGSLLAPDEPTWAHRLNRLGYETAMIGRMHFNGPDQHHGFQIRAVPDDEPVFGRRWAASTLTPADWDGPLARARKGLRHLDAGPGETDRQIYDDQVVAAAKLYLNRVAVSEKPWAACVGFISPHYPFTVREEYWRRYYPRHADLPETTEEELAVLHPQNRRFREFWGCADAPDEVVARARAGYYGLVSFVDDRLGEIIDHVESLGLVEQTMIVYLSDHGELHGDHGMWCKASFYEQSVRIPMIISWAGHFLEAARLSRVTSLVDLVRTVVDLAGSPSGLDDDLDGTSLVPLLLGEEPDGGGEALSEFTAQMTDRPARMIRRGRYKLNYYWNEPLELYDLESDPRELTNLAALPAAEPIVAELTAAVLHGWDPAEIDMRVRENQAKRRLIVAGGVP